jgi:hypothetical protein
VREGHHLAAAGLRDYGYDDGEHVAKDDTETTFGSMEVFRVVGGRITEVSNRAYEQGVWE